jgi:short-subunit dehydrogenase
MKKSILIIGAGPGLSQGIAEKFGKEGFNVSLISRNASKLEDLKTSINQIGIEADYLAADAGNALELSLAITALTQRSGGFDVVLYNAAVLKQKDILQESSEELVNDFTINVANALITLQAVYTTLKERKGAFLLTGGGFGITPNSDYGSLSIGKAGLRSLAYQLNERLKSDGIFAGLVSVAGVISKDSETHSPEILAEDFYRLYSLREAVEIHH